jgi:hypothetical protein
MTNQRSATLGGYIDRVTEAETTDDLAALFLARMTQKLLEEDAAAKRKELDAKIIGIIRAQHADKEEGDITVKAGAFSATIKLGYTRKVDTALLSDIYSQMSANLQAAFRFKAELALPEWRALTDEERGWLSYVVTTTPATPSLSMKALA